MSKVVVVKHTGRNQAGKLDKSKYRILLESGLKELAGSNNLKAAVRSFLPRGTIGMKANCLTRSLNSTPVALADALSDVLIESGVEENNIIVWDRTNAELEKAGYSLNASSFGRRCFGTDSNGVGYSYDFYSFGKVNSLVTRILTDIVDYNINLALLKDHSIAGLSGGLKNMYGAVNNPNKYHIPNCNPYAAHVSNLRPIREKNRITIVDAVRIQYHAGPGFDSRYIEYYYGIILSSDPVAADRVALEILEHFRLANKLPPLKEAGRPVKYLKTAEEIRLGVADINKIDLTVLHVDDKGAVHAGKLL
jgi:uncharacterized protein (DUF362 family)